MNSKLQKFKFSDKLFSLIKIFYPNTQCEDYYLTRHLFDNDGK